MYGIAMVSMRSMAVPDVENFGGGEFEGIE